MVTNPYTLLTSIKEIYKWFTVIDLKDAFSASPLRKKVGNSLPLSGKTQGMEEKTQLTWTRQRTGTR